VLVSPRNPLNIGAVARAMANFGFARFAVAAPYAPNWREARSAVGAPDLLQDAQEFVTLGEALAGCTFVIGTGTLAHRKPDQLVVSLPDLQPILQQELAHGGRAALVFGPEKHGLTREDLSWCHVLVEIPTDPRRFVSTNWPVRRTASTSPVACPPSPRSPQAPSTGSQA
jgi:TrmH family RNA methyltransferase